MFYSPIAELLDNQGMSHVAALIQQDLPSIYQASCKPESCDKQVADANDKKDKECETKIRKIQTECQPEKKECRTCDQDPTKCKNCAEKFWKCVDDKTTPGPRTPYDPPCSDDEAVYWFEIEF